MDKELIDPKARNALIGALQAFRHAGAHHDSAQGQADMDKVLAAIDQYAALMADECAKVCEAEEPCGGPYVHDIARAIRAKFSPDPTP